MNGQTKVAVIGAGVMGLTCAYELLKNGYNVSIYEKDDRLGGMSASFNFDGLKIERYYHFICGPDQSYFQVLKELGIYEKLKWIETKMGFFYNGSLYKWGNPLYLLTFPKLDPLSKFLYGWHIFRTTKIKNWDRLDGVNAVDWIKKNVGKRAYEVLWSSLFSLKFHEFKNNLSAAWIGTRLKRVGLSRKNIFTEKLGYLEGGTDTFLWALNDKIKKMGGRIELNTHVEKIETSDGKTTGIRLGEKRISCDIIASTVPLPYVSRIIPQLSKNSVKIYQSIDNVGVVCVILKLRKKLTENFWLNINDPSIDIPGLIEYTNLNPLNEKVVYIPFYLHRNDKRFSQGDEIFLLKVMTYLKKINPEFNENWILSKRVHRYEYAQPICPPRFLAKIPPIKTDIDGLYVADTSHYYPEDRSISESIRVGKNIGRLILEK